MSGFGRNASLWSLDGWMNGASVDDGDGDMGRG